MGGYKWSCKSPDIGLATATLLITLLIIITIHEPPSRGLRV